MELEAQASDDYLQESNWCFWNAIYLNKIDQTLCDNLSWALLICNTTRITEAPEREPWL